MRQFLLAALILGGRIAVAAPATPADHPSSDATPASSLAATTPEDTSPQAQFDEQLVVTGSLAPERREDLPAAVTIVDREEIEARQETEVLGLLATVPGLQVVQSGSPGAVASLFSRGTGSNQTLALWNGVPLNDPSFGGFDWAFLSTEGIERIEVVRGPFSALYGSEAVGGVVQILSNRLDGGSFQIEAGEDSYLRGALSAGFTRNRFRLDVSTHLREGEGELENDFYDGKAGSLRAHWNLGSASGTGSRVGFLFKATDADTGIPFNFGTPSPRRRQATETRQLAIPVVVEAGRWSLDAQLSAAETDFRFRDPDDFFRPRADTDTERLRGRLVFSRRLGSDLRAAVGTDWERQEVTDASAGTVVLDQARQRNRSLFGELTYRKGPARLTAGLRHDDNSFFGTESSPKLGLLLDVGSATRLRAQYGEGFRAPAVSELQHPSFGNPELQPETSRAYEVGVEHRVGSWRLDVAAFEIRQRNLIDFNLATFTLFNVGRSRSRGLEAVVAYRGRVFGAELNGTVLDAEDRDSGLDLLRRPEKSANLVLTAHPEGWVLSLVARHVGERPDIDPVTFGRATNPGYTRLDLGARWEATDHAAPYGRIENAADREYEEALGFPALGRHLVVGLAVDF